MRADGTLTKRERSALRAALATPETREALWLVLQFAQPMAECYVPGDIYATLRITGRQNVGRWWMTQLAEADFELYRKMEDEARERAEFGLDRDDGDNDAGGDFGDHGAAED